MSFQLIRSEIVENEEGKFKKYILDEDKLSKLIDEAGSRKTEIAVLAIAGAFRTGKSFLLSVIYNYLDKLSNGKDPWEDEVFSINDGFKFRRGQDPETEGIYCSNKIFTIPAKTDSGKLSVILLDTEGAFDHRSTMQDNATIFSLSTFYSSMQLANVVRQIQSTDIANLQMFTEVGKLAIDGNIQRKPFQDFIFLIRDYEHDDENGFDEGQKMLDKIDSESARVVNKEATPNVRDVFQTFRACCLPHPGKIVTKKKFTGDLNECDEDFVKTMKGLLQEIFARLQPKTNTNGDLMSVKDIANYFRAYAEIFAGDTIPKTGNIIDVSAMCHYQGQLAASKKDLEDILEEHFNIKEIRSYEEVHERQIKCTRIYNELNQKRRFLNHLVYAKKFWEETANVFDEKMKEKIINYQLEHDKKLSEEEKAKMKQEIEESKQAAVKRQEEFKAEIKAMRDEIEKERQNSREMQEKLEREKKENEAKDEREKLKEKIEEQKKYEERELREAQMKAIEKQQKTLERLERRDKRGFWKRLWNLN